MRMRLLLARLAVACLAGACCVTPVAAEETSRLEGEHFAVVTHFESPELAQVALEQIEALWPEAAALYGLPRGAREQKLTVHLYRDATDYEVAEEKLTGGRFRRNLAFAHHATKSAHVALQPDLTDEALARVGLPYLTRSMLLHEAAHLVRYDAMANFPSHPGWFYDGAAMLLKHRVLAGDAIEDVPLSSTIAVRGQALLKSGELPSVAQLLADETDALSFFNRYNARYLFFRFLYEVHGKKLRQVLKETRRMGGGSGFKQRMADLLRRSLGTRRFHALDEGLREFIEALQPTWEEPHRSLGPGTSEFIQCAFPKTNAVAWRTQPVDKTSYTFSATVEIVPNAAHQVNVLLDRSDAGFLCVALSAGYGVTLFDYTSKDSNWKRVESVKNAAVVAGKPFRVEARVDGPRLDLSIDGAPVLGAEFPGRSMRGPWGLGALAGSVGHWKDVQVK